MSRLTIHPVSLTPVICIIVHVRVNVSISKGLLTEIRKMLLATIVLEHLRGEMLTALRSFEAKKGMKGSAKVRNRGVG